MSRSRPEQRERILLAFEQAERRRRKRNGFFVGFLATAAFALICTQIASSF